MHTCIGESDRSLKRRFARGKGRALRRRWIDPQAGVSGSRAALTWLRTFTALSTTTTFLCRGGGQVALRALKRGFCSGVLELSFTACGSGGSVGGGWVPAETVQPPSTLEWAVDCMRRRNDWRSAADLGDEIGVREATYTRSWLEHLIAFPYRRSLLGSDGHESQSVRFYQGLGRDHDDGVVSSWSDRGVSFEAIDTRVLIVHVKPNASQSRTASELFVECFDHAPVGFRAEARLVETDGRPVQGLKTWGVISATRGGVWLAEPVAWYSGGDVFTYVINKRLTVPSVKGSVWSALRPSAARYFGGLPPEDRRAFLRFRESNRESLSLEYFDRFYKPQ